MEKLGMSKPNAILILAVMFLFLIPVTMAQVNTRMSLQGRLTNSTTGGPIDGEDLRVTISNGTDDIYDCNHPSAVNDGLFSLLLGIGSGSCELSLEYNKDYYLDMYVGTSSVSVGGPYMFRGGQGEINLEDVADVYLKNDGDIGTGDYIFPGTMLLGTYGSNAYTLNVGSGDAQFADNVNVMGNVGIGQGSHAYTLDVSGLGTQDVYFEDHVGIGTGPTSNALTVGGTSNFENEVNFNSGGVDYYTYANFFEPVSFEGSSVSIGTGISTTILNVYDSAYFYDNVDMGGVYIDTVMGSGSLNIYPNTYFNAPVSIGSGMEVSGSATFYGNTYIYDAYIDTIQGTYLYVYPYTYFYNGVNLGSNTLNAYEIYADNIYGSYGSFGTVDAYEVYGSYGYFDYLDVYWDASVGTLYATDVYGSYGSFGTVDASDVYGYYGSFNSIQASSATIDYISGSYGSVSISGTTYAEGDLSVGGQFQVEYDVAYFWGDVQMASNVYMTGLSSGGGSYILYYDEYSGQVSYGTCCA